MNIKPEILLVTVKEIILQFKQDQSLEQDYLQEFIMKTILKVLKIQ